MTHQGILGAIIAGGAARRFGSDKGAALLHNVALIDHIAAALGPQVNALLIVGRAWRDLPTIPDYPRPDLGPLGGLNAALRYAAAQGYQEVLTAGCDTLPVPRDLTITLPQSPAVVAGHYLFGRWPVSLAPALDAYLSQATERSMRAWLTACGAAQFPAPQPLHNLNTPSDLARYAATLSSAGQP